MTVPFNSKDKYYITKNYKYQYILIHKESESYGMLLSSK